MTIERPKRAQPMAMQPRTFVDFSGGITDYFLDSDLSVPGRSKYERADNLILFKHGAVGRLITRPGSVVYDTTYPQIPAGAQRIGTLIDHADDLWFHSSNKFYFIDAGWTTLVGPSSNNVFPAAVDTTTAVAHASWKNQLFVVNSDFSKPQKIFRNQADTRSLVTAGLPALASSPTATPTSVGAGFSYLYRFVMKYTYNVGTVQYIDRGPSVEVAMTSTAAISGGNAVTIASIPILANGVEDNYDTANIYIEIYRTTNGGNTFYKMTEVINGSGGAADITTDATLITNEQLYTNGGIVENDPPPRAKLIHIIENRAYYAHCKIDTEVFDARIYQSIDGDVDSVPATFFTDVDEPIVGLSSARGIPIVACEDSAYRIDGTFDLLGRGEMTKQRISDRCSCVSAQSMVQTLDGVFWAGKDGFYFCDSYNVIRINKGWDKTYNDLVSSDERKRRIVGRYDPKQGRVWWTAQKEAASTDCDTIFVLDLNWGISDDMPFTTISGGENFAPTAIEMIDGELIRGDTRGYTFHHKENVYNDPAIDLTESDVTLWGNKTIIYDFKSLATSFGTVFKRKFVPRVGVTCFNETNVALQINVINDLGRRTGSLKAIRNRNNLVWGDIDVYWGDSSIVWDAAGVIDVWRRVPAGNLRCEYMQLHLTNASVAIVSSDLIGSADINGAASTATLTNTALYDWPSDPIDYVIALEQDGYVKEYPITARTADVLTFSDSAGSASTLAAQGWVLRGKPKGEVLHLINATIHYTVFGKTQGSFDSGSTGEVGV